MSLKAVLKNINKNGVGRTWKAHKKNDRLRARVNWASKLNSSFQESYMRDPNQDLSADERKALAEFADHWSEWLDKQVELLERYYLERPFKDLKGKKYREAMDDILELENLLKAHRKKGYRAVLKRMKACYIKERIPEIYAEVSQAPVVDKVVFVENVNCPSPSNAHLISVLKQEGKYAVVKIGLQRRKVSELEYYENSLKFAREIGDAKAIFISTANDLLSSFDVRPETKVIQLWHGLGMFKKCGHSTVDNPNFGRGVKSRAEYDQYRNYSYVTIPAKAQAWTFEDSMHISQDSGILVDVGVARTDVFYSEQYRERSLEKLHQMIPESEGKKVILYSPTFRGSVGNAKAPNKLEIDKLAAALSDEYVLVIKHHGTVKNVPEIPEEFRDKFAFDVTKRKYMSIDRLLSVADIMITDYSSLGFEYAILERPIIFFAYDLEDYIDNRGIYYNYEDITPGPVYRTTDEIVDYVLHIEDRFDKQAVIDFKQEYVGRCDGHATERTIALIES